VLSTFSLNSFTARLTPSARRKLFTHLSVVHTKRFWIGAWLGLALVLGQVGGYVHMLAHLQDLAGDKTTHHTEICPFDASYAQLASGLAQTALPVPVCAKPNDAPLIVPQPTVRSALIFLPFARAPPSQS
jgi:hypothetical protein